MTQRQWLKPAECARRIGYRDAGHILSAIKKKTLPARAVTLASGRTRYLVHIEDFQRWFDQTWREVG